MVALEHALWQLLEAFFLPGGGASLAGEGYPVEDLVTFLAANHTVLQKLSVAAAEAPPLDARVAELAASRNPEGEGDYWQLVGACVAMGRLAEALRLLGAHGAMRVMQALPDAAAQQAIAQQYELLDALYMLLRSMPRFKHAGAQDITGRAFDSMPEYTHYRSTWRSSVAQFPAAYAPMFDRCAASSPGTAQGVCSVLAIMSGDAAALQAATSHWLELLVAQLVHVHPETQAQHALRRLADGCVEAKPISAEEPLLQVTTLAPALCLLPW